MKNGQPVEVSIVFPAPAGINRVVVAGQNSGDGVPRASGDKPYGHGRLVQF